MGEREFKGVWIPAEIWLDESLTLVEKALYAEIDSFTGAGKSFHKSNETIQHEYGVSRPTISKAIKKLEALEFIMVAFDGRKRHLTVQADRKNFTGSRKNSFGQQEKNLRAAGKNSTSNNTIEKTAKNTFRKQRVEMPFEEVEFHDMWETWKRDRKERGIKKMSSTGEQTALHKLYEMSNGNYETAIAIIQQSIAQGWQGLFPIKQAAGIKLDPTATLKWANQ